MKSEILYQNFINNSILSGVVTNRCLKDGTEYYVINYDDTSNKTNTVTSGGKKSSRVLNIFKKNSNNVRSPKFRKIIESVKEIESKISGVPIDIEFAVDKNKKVNIFQIRPLSTLKNWKNFSNRKFRSSLKSNQNKFLKILKENKKYGNDPIFGLMPDWNPAEMIGYQPNMLSYSIYKEIITDNSWSLARAKMGYKYVNKPLMYSFSGKPFIDTRLSFNSLIPQNVNNIITKKLMNYWSNLLKDKPYLHDKIEFQIIDGSFDPQTKTKIFKEYNFLNHKEKNEYIRVLKEFTENKIINHKIDFLQLDKKLVKLEEERIKFVGSFLKSQSNLNKKKIFKFVNKIKDFGIIPFSIYARHAFIAKKFLNSLRLKKIISNKLHSKLLSSVGSITNDFIELEKKSKLSKNHRAKFINYFYHLRPGTYDINVERNDKKILDYKINNLNEVLSKNTFVPELSKKAIVSLENFIRKNNFNLSHTILLKYCLSAIRMRENSKFVFTRSLSDLIEIIKKKGQKYKFSKNDLSKLSLNQVLNLNTKNKLYFRNLIKNNEENKLIDEKIKLPYLITNKNDFYVASILISKPNFVTKKIIKGNLKLLQKKRSDISNKIILIENADPGYDWIFSFNIRGLITKYGGVNSHMSIRCEELNVPAAIGVGEDNYSKIKNFSKIILNCKNEQIIKID